MEALQPCGSFKARGMGHACRQYIEGGAKTLVASSGGNAGLAVAHAGLSLGVPVIVVVPQTTKPKAIELIKEQGARVIIHGENWNMAHTHALEICDEASAYIHPFDDPLIWEGHATIIDEVAEAGVVPDCIVLSVGGGGLLCGVVEGLDRNGWQSIPIVAVETHGADALFQTHQAGEHIGIDSITSIATSLGAKKVAAKAYGTLQSHRVIPHRIADQDAVAACCRFLDDHRILVEPACGAALSVVYQTCKVLESHENILVIVCGGVGVTLDQLIAWQG